MKFKSSIALLLAALFLSAGAVFAQEAPKAEEPKPVVDVSGVLFLDYGYFMKDEVVNGAAKGTGKEGADSLRLMRSYVTFVKKFDDVWSAKLTLDGVGVSEKDNTGKTTANSLVFVKNAYVEMKQKFDPVELKVQYGIVGTPVIGIIDSISGARWIYQNYMDKSSDLVSSDGKDAMDVSSADMGIKADLSIMKMVTFTGMYANGDGYKFTEDTQARDKAYWGVVSITPVKELFINGYYHSRTDADISSPVDATKDTETSYMGGGLAWSDKSFKIGANYFVGEKKGDSSRPENDKDYALYDVYANVNLADVAGVPVLMYGRYAVGETESDAGAASTADKKVDSNTWYAGLGYQFNKNVQAMVVYQSKTDEVKLGNGSKSELTDETLWVKTEIKF